MGEPQLDNKKKEGKQMKKGRAILRGGHEGIERNRSNQLGKKEESGNQRKSNYHHRHHEQLLHEREQLSKDNFG